MFEAVLTDIDVISSIERLRTMSFEPFLKEAGDLMVATTQARMEQGLDPGERPQPANVGRYANWKQQHYGGQPPMMLTGELRDVITAFMKGGGEVDVWVPAGAHKFIPGVPKYISQEPMDYPSIVEGQETGERSGGTSRVIFGMNEKDIAMIFSVFEKQFEPEFM
jgi:hypothetical protein